MERSFQGKEEREEAELALSCPSLQTEKNRVTPNMGVGVKKFSLNTSVSGF